MLFDKITKYYFDVIFRRMFSANTKQRDIFISLPLTEKRKFYTVKQVLTINDIPPWPLYAKERKIPTTVTKVVPDNEINNKISIYHGDITSLEIDAVVNAANKSLLGGGGVDGAIHKAAGPLLLAECKTLNGCATGQAKTTAGYYLPARFVIHTVGPIGENPTLLKSCYVNSLKEAQCNKCRTIAFPCISTGVYGYPIYPATRVAAETVRDFLSKHKEDFDRIIFCIFLNSDVDVYEKVLSVYFPLE